LICVASWQFDYNNVLNGVVHIVISNRGRQEL